MGGTPVWSPDPKGNSGDPTGGTGPNQKRSPATGSPGTCARGCIVGWGHKRGPGLQAGALHKRIKRVVFGLLAYTHT